MFTAMYNFKSESYVLNYFFWQKIYKYVLIMYQLLIALLFIRYFLLAAASADTSIDLGYLILCKLRLKCTVNCNYSVILPPITEYKVLHYSRFQ